MSWCGCQRGSTTRPALATGVVVVVVAGTRAGQAVPAQGQGLVRGGRALAGPGGACIAGMQCHACMLMPCMHGSWHVGRWQARKPPLPVGDSCRGVRSACATAAHARQQVVTEQWQPECVIQSNTSA